MYSVTPELQFLIHHLTWHTCIHSRQNAWLTTIRVYLYRWSHRFAGSHKNLMLHQSPQDIIQASVDDRTSIFASWKSLSTSTNIFHQFRNNFFNWFKKKLYWCMFHLSWFALMLQLNNYFCYETKSSQASCNTPTIKLDNIWIDYEKKNPPKIVLTHLQSPDISLSHRYIFSINFLNMF